MAKIALVADSTADLPEDVRKEWDIHVIPLKVRFGSEEYLDHEITSEEFYRRLEEADELPRTSQPSPEEFMSLYEELLQDYQEIISVHLSSALSGTLNAANIAKERLKAKVHIVDSKTISLGFGLMVVDIARRIQEGMDSVQIMGSLSKVRQNIETLFTLNTLEYLQKGGRIGRVQGFLGSVLNIKPVVRVGDDGVYQTYGNARSQKKALDLIVSAVDKLAEGRKKVHLVVGHGAGLQAAKYLQEALESALQIKTGLFTQVGPVIGVHTGPGTVGAAVQFE